MPNRLASETSPYLQQHAENPVDWYPWGEEALAEAKRTGKPILLSVGYSACHWCHVMAHESFEDPAIARVMNELFVNVKVDREERPDIDQVYQAAQALLTQRPGGWPLTMFLTPDQLPFFGGTYFPDRPRYGMPGFGELLARVRQVYDENRDALREQGVQVAEALGRMQPRGEAGPAPLDGAPLEAAFESLRESYDREHGGFGTAPKFPRPETIELLLRRYASKGDREALDMATHTLRRMALGGLYDQVGGGFARYSTDAEWAIPHFEKMLYDNAWLLRLYADAWSLTRDPLFERACAETAGWVVREMQSPDGGYYSSLDADSEGEEGRFYVWTPEEIAKLLTPEELAVASLVFGLDRPPNFENRHWHLTIAREPGEAARMMQVNESDIQVRLDSARRKLRAAREARVRPGRDEKILASWNALMIAGMAHAGRLLGREAWIDSARRALDFLAARLWNGGRMLATHRDGKSHLDAYLDDHAYLLAALLEMLQARFDPAGLAWAREVGEALLARFHDAAEGGFFFTSHDHEALIQRPKPGPDNATPSGNAVAALALHRLAFLTGDTRFSDAAAGTLALFWPQVQRHPGAFGTMLCALEEQLQPPDTLIVTGARDGFAPWRDAIGSAYLPRAIVLFIPAGTSPLPEALAKPSGDMVNAWLCRGVTCLPPIDTPERLRQALDLPKMPAPDLTPPSLKDSP